MLYHWTTRSSFGATLFDVCLLFDWHINIPNSYFIWSILEVNFSCLVYCHFSEIITVTLAEITLINIALIIMYNTTNKKNIVGLWNYPKSKDTVTKLNDMNFFFSICVVEWKKWILKVDIWPLLVTWNTHVCIHTY